ncbi:MAG: FMN-dependent NADH-azoreductase [Planctomycetaceae bacterium]|nr:FMN-dependent NADH-azoreductase [Planctomycetaceae bacterium]
MARLLHLDASPRGERSLSRRLTREFVEGWLRLHPDDSVVYRDVGRQPVPRVTEAWIEGAFNPPATWSADARAATQTSDLLVDEFLAADRYVFGVPMHNFGVPSTLKAYVDQIVRVGRTFTPEGRGLATGKRLLVLTARGGTYPPGSPTAAFDLQEPWLRTIFGFIGVTEVRFIHAEGLNGGDAARQAGLQSAREQMASLLNAW